MSIHYLNYIYTIFMKYFTIKELTKSSIAESKGLNNTPNKQQEQNLVDLVDNILDPLREAYGKPIIISSGFRSKEVNDAAKGAKSSQHLEGSAADIKCQSDTVSGNKELFDLIQKLKLPFDQLIDEYNYNWVHVSYSPKHRRQILHIK